MKDHITSSNVHYKIKESYLAQEFNKQLNILDLNDDNSSITYYNVDLSNRLSYLSAEIVKHDLPNLKRYILIVMNYSTVLYYSSNVIDNTEDFRTNIQQLKQNFSVYLKSITRLHNESNNDTNSTNHA